MADLTHAAYGSCDYQDTYIFCAPVHISFTIPSKSFNRKIIFRTSLIFILKM